MDDIRSYLKPTNSSQSGIRFHLWTVSNGPKSSVRDTAVSGQLWSNPIFVKLSDIVNMKPYSLNFQNL